MKHLNLFTKFLCRPVCKLIMVGLVSTALFISSSNADDRRRGFSWNKNKHHGNGISYVLRHHKKWSKPKYIKMSASLSEADSSPMNGVVALPKYVTLYYGYGVTRNGAAQIIVDNDIVCNYGPKNNRRYWFGNRYYFQDCSNGSRPGEQMKVNSEISLVLKNATQRKGKAKVKGLIKIVQRFHEGLKIPFIDAKAGQVLVFDGELWSPKSLIPEGNEKGEVLSWDGTGWVPSSVSGTQGDKGDKGDKGDAGVQGIAGVAGADGAIGPAGAKGEDGAIGATGAAGIQGPKGDTGAAGVAGAAGAQGLKGDTGATGANGAAGVQGIKGDTGAAGVAGATGAQGPIGLTGPQGATGATGAQGVKGDTGLTGAVGPQGPAGANGIAGTNGLVGATGPQGIQGPQGAAGVDGVAGAKGDAGVAGANGAQGIQGPIGLTGPQGAAGEDASVALVAGAGMKPGTGPAGEILSTDTVQVDVGTGANQIPQLDANGKLPASVVPDSAAPPMDLTNMEIVIKDVKPNGTHGGGCTAGVWAQRDLNTREGGNGWVTLANNEFTLEAGTYSVAVEAPAYLDNIHKAKLTNSGSGATVAVGTTGRTHTSYGGVSVSRVRTVLTITEATTYRVDHRCSVDRSVVGFGLAANFGVDEVYTQVEVTKLK